MKYTVFDIETANIPDDWQDHEALGISWAVCYRSWEDRYAHYQVSGIQALAATLASSELIVSWNGLGFDMPLLQATARKLDAPIPYFDDIAHCDLMVLCENQIGAKLGLGEVATWTLGQGKIGTGSHAPELARAGEYGMLASYCEHDVWLTKRLFEFARDNGYLLCEGGRRIPMQVHGGIFASDPVGEPATDKQLRYLADLQQRAGQPVKLAGLTKGQARNEIERLRNSASG